MSLNVVFRHYNLKIKMKEKKSKHKKSKKSRRRDDSTSEDSSFASSNSEEEWVEKAQSKHKKSKKTSKKSKKSKREYSSSSEEEWIEKSGAENPKETQASSSQNNRDEWMSLPTSFLSSSNQDKRREREDNKRLENERKQYNPRECPRELNPYWKDGGDGLPSFKKPSEESFEVSNERRAETFGRKSSWRKEKQEDKVPEKSPQESQQTVLQTPQEDEENETFTEKDLNILASKLVKAEIMGNSKLVEELKQKLDDARQNVTKAKPTKETEVILTQTDGRGQARPLRFQAESSGEPSNYKRKKALETHKDGERVRYFANDDKYSLKQMVEDEKYNSTTEQQSEFARMASKIRKNDDLDEAFFDNIRRKQSDHKIESKTRDKAIFEHQNLTKSLDNCSKCLQSTCMQKHLLICMSQSVYLSLPSFEPLTENHCLISPIRHTPSSTQLDENEWAEILDIRRSLTEMFKSQNLDVIFFETARNLHKHPHLTIECVPVPVEQGDLAPIYFKKAIDESEIEWSQNKKLVSLKGRDVRKAIPKNLPYFSVSFGMQEGFAHVIEDEQLFPDNFAQEIIGGMLDLEHFLWKKPRRQKFEEQSKRVLAFSKAWKQFDCTGNKIN